MSFFGSVFKEENLLTLPNIKQLGGEYLHTLSDVAISEAIIVRELREMKGNKAAGEDGLGSIFLKEIEDAVAASLAVLFRKSLDVGVVSVDWKVENITPMYKKGPKQDPGNYRPVSPL